jgi:hypothetical protein
LYVKLILENKENLETQKDKKSKLKPSYRWAVKLKTLVKDRIIEIIKHKAQENTKNTKNYNFNKSNSIHCYFNDIFSELINNLLIKIHMYNITSLS